MCSIRFVAVPENADFFCSHPQWAQRICETVSLRSFVFPVFQLWFQICWASVVYYAFFQWFKSFRIDDIDCESFRPLLGKSVARLKLQFYLVLVNMWLFPPWCCDANYFLLPHGQWLDTKYLFLNMQGKFSTFKKAPFWLCLFCTSFYFIFFWRQPFPLYSVRKNLKVSISE